MMDFIVTLSMRSIECHYVECRFFIVMLNVYLLSVVSPQWQYFVAKQGPELSWLLGHFEVKKQ